jgi:starch-binding outer membrane protein, SusD/RagB family
MKIYKFTFILLLGLISTACKDALVEKPLDFTSPNNYFNNANEAKSAAYSLYNTLVNKNAYNISLYFLGDFPSTSLDSQPGNAEAVVLDNFTLDANLDHLDYYQGAYTGILRANLMLERVPPIQMNTVEKDALLGEARFMRAFHYFNLVRFWGDVPLVTTSSLDLTKAVNNSRTDKNQIYSLIKEDLQFAEKALPTSYPPSEVGRSTKGAAKLLLAKVHLTLKEFDLARTKSKEVMDLGVYKLMADYRDVFDPAKKNNAEHIFSVQYKMFKVGSWFEAVLSPGGTTGCGFGEYVASVGKKFYNEYPTSYRKEVSMMTTYTATSGAVFNYSNPSVKKFIAWGKEDVCFSSDHNFPIMRYADAILVFAEAENEVSGPTAGAYDAINQIRKRARTYPNGKEDKVSLPDLAGLTKDSFRQAVYKEREMELCFEGHGFFDLVRTGRLITENKAIGKSNVAEKHLLMPFSQKALDLNQGLKQNPGY